VKQKITIVIPVFNESKNLDKLYERLNKVTSAIINYRWEYIFINDGSTDDSLEVLRELAVQDDNNKVIDLSRNFGKEICLTAGVHEAGDASALICIDADLQHPPELIPSLVEHWEKGSEIVATIRTSIEKQPILKRMGSTIFYWLMSKISGVNMASQTTDYRLYDKKVIQAFCRATERERMFRGIMDWMGFNKTYIKFQANARIDGDPGYSYAKLWHLAINTITSFSLVPLKLTGYLGLLITLLSGLLLCWMLIDYFVASVLNYSPLAIIVVANTFLIGLVLMGIGLVALYVGSIHTEVINRPLYIVRERLNFSQDSEIKENDV